jgi:uncharacterized protein (TIGR02246 family)
VYDRLNKGELMHAKLSVLCLGIVAALIVVAPSSANMAPPPDILAERDIRAVDAELLAAIQNRDAAKVASLYAADGTVLSPGSPPIEGREAITAFYAAFLATPGLDLKFEITKIKVSASGDVAVTQGPYTLTMGEGEAKTVEQGKSVTTWVLTDEGWRMYTDMFSSNGPSAPQAAEAAPPPTPEKAN